MLGHWKKSTESMLFKYQSQRLTIKTIMWNSNNLAKYLSWTHFQADDGKEAYNNWLYIIFKQIIYCFYACFLICIMGTIEEPSS